MTEREHEIIVLGVKNLYEECVCNGRTGDPPIDIPMLTNQFVEQLSFPINTQDRKFICASVVKAIRQIRD